MNKEKLFNEIIEGILSCRGIQVVQNGTLEAVKDVIVVNDGSRLVTLYYIPSEFESFAIHGNTRKVLASEFIKTYDFEYLKALYDEQLQKEVNHKKNEDDNKHLLIDLMELINLKEFEKFSRNKIELKFVNFLSGKYEIEFYCKKNNYTGDTIQIYLSENYNSKFLLRFNYQDFELTAQEIKNKLDEVYNIYNSYYLEVEEIKRKKLEEENKKINIDTAIYSLYSKNINNSIIVLRTSKKSYTAFVVGLRYAVGTGKSGKYIKSNSIKFDEFINKKGVEKVTYTLLDKDFNTCALTDEELNKMSWKNII